MTQNKYIKLKKTREMMSITGYLLMVLNLCIGIAAIVVSLITNKSIAEHETTILAVFFISMIIGMLAVADTIIYLKIRSQKIFD